MNILAIDSSSAVASATLYLNGNLDSIVNEDKLTHSQKLLPLIDTLLKRNNVSVKDIDVFVSSKGPGSFTGIRIGISTIKALAHVANKNIAGYTSLDMLAQSALDKGKYICSCIDAKHENVYYGVYKVNGKKLETILENSCDTITNVIEKCKKLNENIVFVGDGSVNYREYIEKENFATILDNIVTQKSEDLISLYLANPQEVPFADFIPVYLRESQAERNLKK